MASWSYWISPGQSTSRLTLHEKEKKNKLFMPLLLWVLCNMHSDILLTNSVELEGKVKEISKKTNQKKKSLKIKKW